MHVNSRPNYTTDSRLLQTSKMYYAITSAVRGLFIRVWMHNAACLARTSQSLPQYNWSMSVLNFSAGLIRISIQDSRPNIPLCLSFLPHCVLEFSAKKTNREVYLCRRILHADVICHVTASFTLLACYYVNL